jgi:hypothetical protein
VCLQVDWGEKVAGEILRFGNLRIQRSGKKDEIAKAYLHARKRV